MAYSKELRESVEKLLKELKWEYRINEYEDRCIFRLGVGLDEDIKISKISYVINVQEEDISIISSCTIKADIKNRIRMAEFICRANYGLKDGNFEFDYDDGTIRYKSYIYDDKKRIDENQIAHSIVVSTEMWIMYGNGIVDVLGSNKKPKDIIAQIEKVKM